MEKVHFSEPMLFLNFIGMHPGKSGKFARLRQKFSIAVYIMTLSSGMLEIVFNSEGLETYARASDTMIPQYQLLAKMSVLVLDRRKILQLLKDSQKFWPLSEFGSTRRKEIGKTHVYLRRFFMFYKYSIAFTCLQFLGVKIITRSPKPLCISFGENREHGPAFQQFYLVLHAFVTAVAINIITGFDGLFFYFIAHTLSELEMVKIAFGEYEICKSWDERERFKTAAKHHSEVLDFIEKFNDIFSKVFLVQHLSSLFGICFGLFLMSQNGLPPSFDLASKYMPYIASFTVQTWTFCFARHLVYDRSSEIPIQLFYNGWDEKYHYDNVRGRVIAMNRGQKAAKLTLGGFGDLNLESFKMVMQKAFSFLTFINTMMKKKSEMQ